MGKCECFVTQNNPEDFSKLGSLFDLVVVDAPCSGEGLFRRDPEAAEEWSEEAVQHCAVRQTDILQQAMSALKRGGILIYSTCTFEKAEDEDQIQSLIDSGEAELIELGKHLKVLCRLHLVCVFILIKSWVKDFHLRAS